VSEFGDGTFDQRILDWSKMDEDGKALLRELVAEVNRTLNMIVTAKHVKEIRWGATAGVLIAARRYLESNP
jgi:hypothetical protein